MATLEVAERRVREIEETFGRPGYYDRTPADEITALDGERLELAREIERATGQWDEVERALESLAE
jgi:hypothetical protein